MVVLCDITQCAFNDNGFCCDKAIRITNNGTCKWLANPRWNESVMDACKEKNKIITLVKREENKEKGES